MKLNRSVVSNEWLIFFAAIFMEALNYYIGTLWIHGEQFRIGSEGCYTMNAAEPWITETGNIFAYQSGIEV